MGEVYRARDTRLERTVAVKILPGNFSADAERLRRFEQEARAAAALNHPNILSIYDIGTESGSPYIVSELLEGDTMRDRLREGALPLRKAIEYGAQVARGLAAAHDKGIVHRDLKPENIFVTKDGRAKILDFGLAKLAGPATGTAAAGAEMTNLPTMDSAARGAAAIEQHTTPGLLLGTVGYMSPEQVRGQASDHRADIFSLGAILYEMLAGKRAFKGATSADTMSAILKEDPAEISEMNRTVPPGIDRIVRHCLEKNPEERFQSARDVAFGLEALSTVSSTTLAESAAGAQRAAPLRWMLWAVPAFLLFLAAVFVGGRLSVAPANPVFTRLSFRGGYIASARFAPDGQTIVYSAGFGSDPLQIYTTRPEATQSRELGFRQSSILGISRGDEMAITLHHEFFIANASAGTLARVPFTGGAPREVAENVLSADWSPDGNSLAIARQVSGRTRVEYPVGKVLYETNGWVSDVRVSPDGRSVAFLDHPILFDSFGSVAMVDTAAKKTVLTGNYLSALGLAWNPSGKEIWFTASKIHLSSSLYAVTTGGHERLVLAGAGSIILEDVSHDGRVLFIRAKASRGVAGLFPGQAGEIDLSWQDWTIPTAISPDGKWLYFSEEGDGAGPKYSAYMRATDGSPAIRLGDGTPWGVSRDGKWVASIIPGDPQQMVLLPTGAGEAVNPSQPGFNYALPEWLPDGKRLLVTGNYQGKPPRTYLMDVASGKLAPVTPEDRPGFGSADGNAVIVVEGDKATFYSLEGKPMREARSLVPDIRFGARAGSDRYFYGVFRVEVPLKVYRFDAETGEKQLWKELAPADRAGVYSVGPICITPDAKWYAYSYVRALGDLYMAEGLK